MFWQLLCGLMLGVGGALLTAHGEHISSLQIMRMGGLLLFLGGGVLGMLMQRLFSGLGGKKRKPE